MHTWTGPTEAENGSGDPGRRHREEFEAVTVRAAMRVLELRSAGLITDVERRFYLSELADMDGLAGSHPDVRRLERLAREALDAEIDRAMEAASFALAA